MVLLTGRFSILFCTFATVTDTKKHKIEVCFTPAVYQRYHNTASNVVIVDILRATTSIITAFMNGVNKLIPVGTLEEAKAYKDKGFMVAAERDGIVRDFADFGNCPSNFSKERVAGKDIVYSTTNGTQAITMAKDCHMVAIGGYTNISALADHLISDKRDVVILCAGWKDKFNIEDTLFAGALAEKILKDKHFWTDCDSTFASIDLWNIAKNDLSSYLEKAAQRHRLKKNKLDHCIEYCHTADLTKIIPVLKNSSLVTLC